MGRKEKANDPPAQQKTRSEESDELCKEESPTHPGCPKGEGARSLGSLSNLSRQVTHTLLHSAPPRGAMIAPLGAGRMASAEHGQLPSPPGTDPRQGQWDLLGQWHRGLNPFVQCTMPASHLGAFSVIGSTLSVSNCF